MKNSLYLLICFFISTFVQAQGTLKLVKDLSPGSWSGVNNSNGYGRLCSVKNILFVVGDDFKVGEELFKYDDKNEQLTLVKDIRPKSSYAKIYQMKAHNDKLFFAADNDTIGLEQWVSDGTPEGTYFLKDINLNGDGVSEYNNNSVSAPFGFVFKADNATNGTELWITDGTKAGTKLLKDIMSGASGSNPHYLYYHPGLKNVYFTAYDQSFHDEVFQTNGTSAGTKLAFLANPTSGEESNPEQYFDFNGKLAFVGRTGFDFSNGNYFYELFMSDGTKAGTNSIFKISLDNSDPSITILDKINSNLFFTCNNNLYVTDGTSAGVKQLTKNLLIKNYYPFGINQNKMLFVASDSLHGIELFISDGTIPGTKLLKDINSGTSNSNPYFFTNLKSKTYFIAHTGLENKQVWETDGTELGTKIAFELNTNGSSYVSELAVHNDVLYIVGGNDQVGTELWSYKPINTKISRNERNTIANTYPNPVQSNLNVELNDSENDSYAILDINGKIILNGLITNKRFFIDVSKIQQGIYFLNLNGKDKQVIRFIK